MCQKLSGLGLILIVLIYLMKLYLGAFPVVLCNQHVQKYYQKGPNISAEEFSKLFPSWKMQLMKAPDFCNTVLQACCIWWMMVGQPGHLALVSATRNVGDVAQLCYAVLSTSARRADARRADSRAYAKGYRCALNPVREGRLHGNQACSQDKSCCCLQ